MINKLNAHKNIVHGLTYSRDGELIALAVLHFICSQGHFLHPEVLTKLLLFGQGN